MKDALGQERSSVRPRELTLAVLFLALVGVGVWTVALPALNEDPGPAESATAAEREEPQETDESPEPAP